MSVREPATRPCAGARRDAGAPLTGRASPPPRWRSTRRLRCRPAPVAALLLDPVGAPSLQPRRGSPGRYARIRPGNTRGDPNAAVSEVGARFGLSHHTPPGARGRFVGSGAAVPLGPANLMKGAARVRCGRRRRPRPHGLSERSGACLGSRQGPGNHGEKCVEIRSRNRRAAQPRRAPGVHRRTRPGRLPLIITASDTIRLVDSALRLPRGPATWPPRRATP
jgi:hypothetical protein